VFTDKPRSGQTISALGDRSISATTFRTRRNGRYNSVHGVHREPGTRGLRVSAIGRSGEARDRATVTSDPGYRDDTRTPGIAMCCIAHPGSSVLPLAEWPRAGTSEVLFTSRHSAVAAFRYRRSRVQRQLRRETCPPAPALPLGGVHAHRDGLADEVSGERNPLCQERPSP
jgi:hypothetical protein